MKGNQDSVLMWAIIATLLCQKLVIPVLSIANFEDQKNFFHFPPNPYTKHIPPISSTPTIWTNPPTGLTPSPPQGSGTPSNGGSNCPNPPSGVGHQSPTPTHPKSSSGGQYHHRSPPSSTPTTPASIPTPPFRPKTPLTGTCNFWKNHPEYIVAILGWSGTLGKAFGLTSVSGFGAQTSILDLLSNNHKDGFGSLCREGTASLLNSMVSRDFPYSTKQVRYHFLASLGSEKAAADQATLFRLANEG